MIKEAYCSFEVAKLLKEKGFDEVCYQKYDDTGYLSLNNEGYINSKKSSEDFYALAPTHQMALAWLREVHNIHIDIWSIWDSIHWLYQVFVTTPRTASNSYVDKLLYTSYEQAVEAAIKYCLKNLI